MMDEALAQAARRSCGYHIPESVRGQTGWGFDLAEDFPVHGRGLEQDGL